MRIEAEALAQALPNGPKVWVVEQVDSTNQAIKAYLATHSPPAVLLAHEQTAGRGRRGRCWHSPPGGGFYGSYAHLSHQPPQHLGTLGLAVATSVVSVLKRELNAPVAIKWPNDFVLTHATPHKKVGGCLVETTLKPEPPHGVIIGLGLNWAITDPDNAVGTAWDNLPIPSDPVGFTARLIQTLHNDLARFEAEGFGAFSNAWSAHHCLAGHEVTVIHQDGPIEVGMAGEVNALGQLGVMTDQGQRWVSAADVSIRGTA